MHWTSLFTGGAMVAWLSLLDLRLNGAEQTKTKKDVRESGSIFGAVAGRSIEIDSEAMKSSDVLLSDSSLVYRETRPNWDYGLQFSESYLDLHYRPAPYELIGNAAAVEESRTGGRLDTKWKSSPHVTLLLGGGAYRGFSDYRSLWLSEFYRQRFGRLPEYLEPRPHGYDIAPGFRWEYLPTSGFFQAGFSYQRDEVASGYEKPIGLPLQRRTSDLETMSGRISLENVISPRARSLLEVQITDTTERELRFSYQGSVNCAIAENWVARVTASGSHEAPSFSSWSLGLSFERNWEDAWFAGVFGRHYRDSGEFSQALPESTAAPDLETWQTGASVRWQADRWAVKLTAGPYFSAYGASTASLNAFERLYRARTWFSGQIALRCTF